MAECDDIIFYSPRDTVGGDVVQPACNTVEQRIPKELREPVDQYESTYVKKLPPIRLFNIEKVAKCQDLPGSPIGEPGRAEYVVLAGYLYRDIDIQVVEDISSQVLQYIRENELIQVIQDSLNSRDCTPQQLVDMTGMRYQQAERLIQIAQREQQRLDDQAEALASAGIDCYFLNDQQAALCNIDTGGISSAYDVFEQFESEQQIIDYFLEVDSDGKLLRPYSNLQGGVKYYYVPYGIVKSKTSKEDANTVAYQSAVAMVVCLFVNDEQILDCTDTDRPDAPILQPGQQIDPVPTPSEQEWENWLDSHSAREYGLQKPVGTVIIPQGTIVSYQSLSDANRRAQEIGWSRLVCYYINDRQIEQCDDPVARNDKVVPDPQHPAVDASIKEKTKGQRVIVPEGYIQSKNSIQEANQRASTLALSLLQCCFTNDDITVECPNIEVRNEHGEVVQVLPYQGGAEVPQAVVSYTVPAGTFFKCQTGDQTSESIRRQLNEQARQLGELQLVCYYCNDIVLPTCAPQWVAQAVTIGIVLDVDIPDLDLHIGDTYFLDLPLEPEQIYNPFTGEKEDLSQWSSYATAGVPANQVCYRDYYPASYIVEEVNEPVKQEGAECPFMNDLVIAGCRVMDPYDGAGRTDKDEPYIFYSQHPTKEQEEQEKGEGNQQHCISDVYSNPVSYDYIEVPAGTFQFTALDVPDAPRQGDPDYDYDTVSTMVKQAANTAALNMAKAMLYCVYANPVTYISCDTSNGFENKMCGDLWWFSQELASVYHGRKVLDGSPVYDNPIIIPYGMFQSKDSMEDVYNRVKVYAESMTFCFYGNNPQSCTCEEKGQEGTQYGGGEVPANVIIDQSPLKADRQAKNLACASAVCIDPIVGPVGPAGPAGPQGPAGPAGPPGQPGNCPGACMGVYT